MSLESVADDIREQARAEAERIREAAEAEADAIIEEAEAEADELRAERKRETERQVSQEREQTVSSAKLEAKQLRLRAHRDALDAVRTSVEEHIADIGGEQRRELTGELLDAALAEFEEGEPLVVHGRATDEALLESLTDDQDRLRIGEPVDRIGGVIVEGTETSMRVDNSFDTVLKEVWEDNLRHISDQLFDE